MIYFFIEAGGCVSSGGPISHPDHYFLWNEDTGSAGGPWGAGGPGGALYPPFSNAFNNCQWRSKGTCTANPAASPPVSCNAGSTANDCAYVQTPVKYHFCALSSTRSYGNPGEDGHYIVGLGDYDPATGKQTWRLLEESKGTTGGTSNWMDCFNYN